MIGADRLIVYALTAHPLDFPKHYVVRRQWATGRGEEVAAAAVACLYDTIAEAADDHRHLHWLGRYRDDDPVIVGCWI